MTSATPKPCPRCQQLFQPTRRNQDYCSALCKQDTNNDKTKAKNALYRKEGPKALAIQKQLDELQAFYLKQVLVAQDIQEVDENTIRWLNQTYTKTKRADDIATALNVTMHRKGGIYIVATKQLIYRRDVDSVYRYPYLYDLKQ
jgi:hypothetical protein